MSFIFYGCGDCFCILFHHFNMSRLIVSDANAKHVKNMEHLHEAKTYAQWSEQDRLSKLPSITPEQRAQIHQYLSMVQQHGFSKSVAAHEQQEKDASGGGSSNSATITNQTCPILNTNHKASPTTRPP
jgi:hypothetical protein